MLRSCPAHGAFDADRCPTCASPGDELLSDERRTRLSKFLSGALRHFPSDVGIEVDREGWAELGALVQAATRKYGWAHARHVRVVLARDPRGRFEIEGDRVRATYGHSIPVEIERNETHVLPERLYHGTPPANLEAIRAEGLVPMGRQQVHLSPDVETAREVALRHGDEAAILEVEVDRLVEEGIKVQRRAETVYTCEKVPPQHLRLVEGSA